MPDQIAYPPRASEIQMAVSQAQTQAKMELLEREYERLSMQLSSIFDGIGRNEQVELVYPDGEVVLITKARPRKAGEGGE